MRTCRSLFTLALALAANTACSGNPSPVDGSVSDASLDGADGSDASTEAGPDVVDAGGPVSAVIDFGVDTTSAGHFYDIPFPSDLRLTPAGTPDYSGFPHAQNAPILTGLLQIAQERQGWPVLPVAYFHFTGPIAPQTQDTVIPAAMTSPVLLVDIDPSSSERGHLVPTVAFTPRRDPYLPDSNTLAVAPRPGFVLHPHRKYAVVVLRSINDAAGRPLEIAPAIAALAAGTAPTGSRGAAALTMYQPMFDTLRTMGVDVTTVADATVFTTGDVVADTFALTERVLANFDVTIDNLSVVPNDSADHPRFCQLVGTVTYPQFQQGVPPFDTQGLFQFDANGVPVPQTYATVPNYGRAPLTLTLPRTPMPAGGYPLVVYFHGSGGLSTSVVDRGTWAPMSPTHPCTGEETDTWNGVTGCFTLGRGPSYIHAQHGFATAGSALPVNPERLPGASETAYLNLNNPASFRDTFRQGVIEQRLFMRALSRLHIPQSVWSQCSGVSLPGGTTEANFDVSRLVAQGQSMGGMYTNLISSMEPMIRASIPTGAGGFWGYFILQTQLIPGAAQTLGVVLGTTVPLTFMHPALALLETAWEPAEPMVYMPRVAREVLPSHPVRPIYETVGQGDSYFPTVVYDAVALAYGHQEAGSTVWPTMQTALTLEGLNGLISYPVQDNRQGADGTPYTGAVIQYAGDGVYDPHAIYAQLDAVKYQYGCFASTFVSTGHARILDPTGKTPDSPCN